MNLEKDNLSLDKLIVSVKSYFVRFWRHKGIGFVYVLPAIILVSAVIFYPIIEGILISFTDRSLFRNITNYVGFQNYQYVFNNPKFWIAFKNSLFLTFFAVSIEYVAGLGLALLLNQHVPGTNFFRNISMISWVIPIAATVMMFKWLLTPDYGIVNIILEKIGLEKWTGYWFGSEKMAMPMVIVMHCWRNIPFFGIALMAAIKSINVNLFEAASIDGATSWKMLWYITLPNIKYTSMVMIVLHALFTFNNFDFVYLSTGGGPVNATEVLPTLIYNITWQVYEFGNAAAVGVIMMFVLMLFTGIYIYLNREKKVV
jgi:multiple sugar transport system permease protein